ncbi:hypothetical protein SAMN04489721_2655 [Agromyces flavus]|nr:hypothetical protein GCM10010932_07250 [Agromyces flavus]SDT16235.1 hypothetical protein SAMN04489721_2655 [Agromyces flavus]
MPLTVEDGLPARGAPRTRKRNSLMQRTLTRTGMAGAFAALTVASVLGASLVAYADNIQGTITDSVSGALVLEAGTGKAGAGGIRVIGTGGDGDPMCNIDSGDPPLVLDIVTPQGITASPDPLTLTECDNTFTPVYFTASSTAVSGVVTVTIQSAPAGGFDNQVKIPITVTYPNTAPKVSVEGVTSDLYEIGSEPTPTCSVIDAEDDPITIPSPVMTGTLTNGLGTLTATCDYTDKGGLKATTASATYRIVDTGKPTISHVLSPADPNANGWFKTPVGIDFTCADGGSGFQSCGPDTTLGDGADQTYTGTAVDWAGNTATDVVSGINIDSVAPGISATLNPAAPDGSNGWYRTAVQVGFECADALSKIDTCLGSTTITDTSAGSATGTATDRAGNTATTSVSGLKVDTVAPTIEGSYAPAKPESGWFKTPVTVHFECDDETSKIAGCTDDTVLGEGEDQSVSGTATDVAGNTGNDTVSDIDVDLTKPTLAFVGDFGSKHYFGAVPSAPNCIAEDALSGLVTPCKVTGGGTEVGTHKFTATAIDRAGNVATTSLTYEVLAWNVKGFTSPVDMAGVLNTVKGGSTVPMKFEIFAGTTELTSLSEVTKFAAAEVTCVGSDVITDEIEFTVTGGTQLRYDATAGQYIQNWATPKKPGSCYRVTMTARDGSSIAAIFKLK